MRELYFREWTKEDKRMRYFVLGQQIRGNYFSSFDDTKIFSIMQFTGLTDINGKKIYEGDIVKYKMPEPLYQNKTFVDIISIVIWDKEEAKFRTNNSGNITRSHKVIGNVHENSEIITKLIKEKNDRNK